jgi:hypothetical protein
MKKITFLLILSLVILTSCIGSDQERLLLENEIVAERKKVDSLQRIVDTLRTKYIFDNLTALHIPNENQPIKEGQEYSGKLYIVAFNKEDRILFSSNYPFKNPDTLSRIEYGGFQYTAVGKKGENNFYFELNIRNKTSLNSRTGEFDGMVMSDILIGE